MPAESTHGIFILVMGVSGCGKSTVGKALADRLGGIFYDADDYHPEINIRKMKSGIPLTDEDRIPWLDRMNRVVKDALGASPNKAIVLACSALKESYRRRLVEGGVSHRIVYLKGSFNEILARVEKRDNHFMPVSLLESQFEDLEEPKDCIEISLQKAIYDQVEEIANNL